MTQQVFAIWIKGNKRARAWFQFLLFPFNVYLMSGAFDQLKGNIRPSLKNVVGFIVLCVCRRMIELTDADALSTITSYR